MMNEKQAKTIGGTVEALLTLDGLEPTGTPIAVEMYGAQGDCLVEYHAVSAGTRRDAQVRVRVGADGEVHGALRRDWTEDGMSAWVPTRLP